MSDPGYRPGPPARTFEAISISPYHRMARMRAGFALTLGLGVLAPAALHAQGGQVAAIDSFVVAEMQREHVPGLALAVVQPSGVLLVQGYGVANVEHAVPVTPETIFQSGSLGKQFTAAGVMLLHQDGLLGLDDPITKFFPDAPASWRTITVRHLLTHTSGIPDYGATAIDFRHDYTEEELTKVAYATKLEFPAGSRWNYSNTGYVLLGILMHRVSGRFYGDLLRERVFAPAGMTTTRVISEADIVPHRAAGYRWVDGQLRNQEWVSPVLNTTADGSLYFSILDLIAWDRALRSGAILSREGWATVYTPVRLTSGRPYPYGFGWGIDTVGGQVVYEHGGSWQGFKSHIARYQGEGLTIIVLLNLAQGDPNRFVEGVAGILDSTLRAPPLVAQADTEPKVTARLKALLLAAAAGTLSAEDFAYVRAGFQEGAKAYQTRLAPLGEPTRLELLRRRLLGDDVVYTYRVSYAAMRARVVLGIAPDGTLSQFDVRRE